MHSVVFIKAKAGLHKSFLLGLVLGLSLGISNTEYSVALAAMQTVEQSPRPNATANVKSSPEPAKLNIEQIPTLIDLPQTPESIEKVLKLEQEGEKYFQEKSIDRALSKWQEAYGLSLEMKYSEGEGRALTNMGRIFLERGQFVKAKYMGENAIEVLADVSDKKALGRAHLYLAQAYFGLDNPVWAGQQLDLALKAFESSGGNNAADTADLMGLAAAVLIKMGKLKESLQFYQAAATYYAQAGDNSRAIASRLIVSDILLNFGLLTASEEEAEKALSMARASEGPSVNVVSAQSSLANAKYALGEYPQALKLYAEAVEIAKKIPPTQLKNVARAGVELGYGTTLAACGEQEQAKAVLESALTVFKTQGASLPQAQTANILAVLEENMGHHERALQLLEQTIDLHNLINPKQENFHIIALQNIATVEARLGHFREARAHLETAASQLRKMKENTLLGKTYEASAEILFKLAEVPEAQRLVREAIALSEKVNDDSVLWREYTVLAKIQLSQNNLVGARDSLTSALSFFRSPQAGFFPSPERLPYPTERADLAEEMIAMCTGLKMTDQAILAAEQLKEEIFINTWLQHGGQVRPEDNDLYADLVNQRAHLHAAEQASSPDKMLNEWQKWLARYHTLVVQNRSLARLLAPVPTTLPEIVKTVQAAHACVLEYLVGNESTVVFTINGSGHISATVLKVGRNHLEVQVSALLGALSKSDANGPQATLGEKRIFQALYSDLIPSGVRELLPADPEQMLVIIPDDVLFNLPFAALLNEQGKYFIENHTLTMASSMGVFLDSPPRYTEDLNLVLASAEDNHSIDQNANQDSEAKAISELFQPENVTRLLGKDADLKSIQDQAKGKAIVHIPDNLKFSENNPFQAVLPIFASREEAGHKATAGRLFGMNLASDLMVWSGTSIDAKDFEGETLNVFTRGLNYAGARNVLMSLWTEPEPLRTSELLDFYKNKQAGLNQAESLRKAELLALSKDASPHSWAAFQLLGPGY